MLRLGQARDRLALGRALALRLRVAVALGTRQALPLALRRCLGRSFAYGLGFGRLRGRLGSGLELWLGLGLGFGFVDGSLGRSGFRLHVGSRLRLGDRCLLGERRLLDARFLGCVLHRLFTGFGRRGDRPLGGGDRLGRFGLLGLFDRLVLCLLVLVLVSHSQLDSRSLLVRSGRSGCGRSHASRA